MHCQSESPTSPPLAARSAGPRHLGRVLAGGALATALATLAAVVHRPYFAAPHVHDDHWLLLLVGLRQTGRLGWLAYLFDPVNTHSLPAWKLVYWVLWRGVGLWPPAWHALVLASHVGGALALAWLVSRYTRDDLAAAATAVAYSLAAVGGWDNPLLWPAAGCLVHATTLFFVAMVAAARAAETQSPGWLACMAAAMIAAVAMWGAMLPLLGVLVVQLWLPSAGTGPKRGVDRRWLAVWGVCCLMLAGFLCLTSVAEISARLRDRASPAPLAAAGTTLVQLAAALGSLLGVPIGHRAAGAPAGALGALALAAVAGAAWKRPAWQLPALLVVSGAVYLMIVNLARPDIPQAVAASWGRYLYFPAACWTAAVGLALSAAFRGVFRLLRGRKAPAAAMAAGLAAAALLALLATAQWRLALVARTELDHHFVGEQRSLAAQRTLVVRLAAIGAGGGERLVMPDLPVHLPWVDGAYYPLSALVAVHVPEESPTLAIVPPDRLAVGDLGRALAAVGAAAERSGGSASGASPSPSMSEEAPATDGRHVRSTAADAVPLAEVARQWQAAIAQQAAVLEHLRWLSRLARQNRARYVVPDGLVRIGASDCPLRQVAGYGFARPLYGVRVVAAPPATDESLAALSRDLERGSGSHAEFWRRWLERYAPGREVPPRGAGEPAGG